MKRKIWIIALFVVVTLTISLAWHRNQPSTPPKTEQADKPQDSTYTTTTDIPESYNWEQFNWKEYEKEWATVDSLEKKGLPQSALKIVEDIYARAQKEENATQIAKALIHQVKYISTREEDGAVKAIYFMEEELLKSQYPAVPLIQSMLGELYWSYYRNNRWRFMNRSTTEGADPKDLLTWDLKRIFNKVTRLHLASISNKKLLQSTPLHLFDAILIEEKESRRLRPSLYDFIAHRALQFFMNDEAGLTKPAITFELTKAQDFSPAATFIKNTFPTKDSASQKWHAIQILRDLIAFHLEDTASEALTDANLIRLHFVRQNSIHPKKDSLYIQALHKLSKTHPGSADLAEVYHKIADYYHNGGKTFRPHAFPEKEREKYILNICNDMLERFPESIGAQACETIKNDILSKNLNLQLEKINPSQKPFRALVKYKNLDKISMRVVPIDRETQNKMSQMSYRRQIQYMTSLKAIKTWTQAIPNPGDYRHHSAEIPFPELPYGKYLFLASANSSFSIEKNAIAHGYFHISDMAYAMRTEKGQNMRFFVSDRTSGKPLKGVKVQLYTESYDYSDRKHIMDRGKQYTTDEEGLVVIRPGSKQMRFKIALTYKEDHLESDEVFYQGRRYHSQRRSNSITYFLTGRKIYRPGQIIYFKGVMIDTDGETHTIKKQHKSTVTFYDVNNRKIASQEVESNEYGSFSGSFTAPSGVLNGQMRIANSYGSTYFSVEEYKRPRFQVRFQAVEKAYRLNETVRLKGTAESYSGAVVDGAKVKYRIVRSAYFPYYRRHYYRSYSYNRAETEIGNGSSHTDKTGTFHIDFKALPDRSIPEEELPRFTYTVYADITDQSGETRSASYAVRAGYIALDIDISIPELLRSDTMHSIPIRSQNLNGSFLAAKGTIEVSRLKAPERIFRNRLWEIPDQFVQTQKEHKKRFPVDPYKEEDNYLNWPVEKQVLKTSFNTSEEKSVLLDRLRQWKQGKYKVELRTKDPYGKPVTLVRYFTLFSPESRKIPLPLTFWQKPLNTSAQPGTQVPLVIGTAENLLYVHYALEHKGELIHQELLKLSKEKRHLDIPILEAYRGGIFIHLSYVKNGRLHTQSQRVFVPWSNKELKMEFATFRDKLKPGEAEEWQVKISGPKGEKVAAEMVATLYDASLEAFQSHYWSFFSYPTNYSQLRWRGQHGSFYYISSQLYSSNWNRRASYSNRSYEQLNWFGYRFGNRRIYAPEMIVEEDMEVAEMTFADNALMDSDAAVMDAVKVSTAKESKKGRTAPLRKQLCLPNRERPRHCMYEKT